MEVCMLKWLPSSTRYQCYTVSLSRETFCHLLCGISNRFQFLLVTYCWSFLLNVSHVEEISEQKEIAQIHQRAIFHVLKWLLAVSTSFCLHTISCKVNDEAHYHLANLNGRDEHVDPACYMEPHCTRCIVSVHKRMNCVIHHHEPTTRARVIGVAVPHIYHDADVVVPMKEDQWLFAKHNENCVAKFVHFWDNKHVRPKCCWSIEVRWAVQKHINNNYYKCIFQQLDRYNYYTYQTSCHWCIWAISVCVY